MMTLTHCRRLDDADPLRPLRAHFHIPPDTIYLDGNSLGLMPLTAPARAAQVVQQEWANGLIRSWNAAGWFDLPQRLGARIAALIGADADEVVAADTTSVNLFKVLSAAIRIAQHAGPKRRVIVSERSNFPTDLYIAQGLCQTHGCSLQLVEADGVLPAGDHAIRWDRLDTRGQRVAPGVYRARLKAGAETRTLDVVLLD